MTAFFAFAHHLAAFAFVAALAAERVLLDDVASLRQARRLLLADLVYGLSAMSLLVIGGLRVWLFEKGAEYYLHNFAFLTKLGAFLLIGLLSIRPTVLFMSWRGPLRENRMPIIEAHTVASARRLVTLELTLLPLLLLAAALMARGHLQLG